MKSCIFSYIYSLFAVYFSGNSFFKLLTIFFVISSSLSILSNYSFHCILALYHMCYVICIELNITVFHLLKNSPGTSLVVQWLGPHAPNAGRLGLIFDQETRSHMLQLRLNTAK